MKKRLVFALLASLAFTPVIAHADPFDVTVSSNGDTATLHFSDVQDAINTLKNENLNDILPNYTTNSPATAVISLRGLNATLSYPGVGTTLVLNIPSINLTRTFTGATRDDSQDALRDFFKGQGGDNVLTSILQKLASDTPIDPVAGNPNSLMSRMGDKDFERGTDSREGFNMSGGQTAANAFNAGIEGGWFHNDVANQRVATVDMTYSHAFADENFSLLFDLPATYVDSDGAKAYDVSFGIGARIPVTQHWALTPMGRVGGVGSEDLGSAAVIYSGSLTSDYRIPLDAANEFQIGDMAGYYKTDGITVGDYRVDYDLSNLRLKNGVAVAHRFTDTGMPLTGRLFFDDSRFFGDDLFDESYEEVGASLGTPFSKWTSLQVGGSYLFAHDYNGVRLSLDFKF